MQYKLLERNVRIFQSKLKLKIFCPFLKYTLNLGTLLRDQNIVSQKVS